MSSRTRSVIQKSFINKVHGLQQQLALIGDNPLLGLQEAAELLSEHFQADLVAIWVLDRQDPSCSILAAALGEGVDVLQRRLVSRGALVGGGAGLHVVDEAGAVADPVLSELWRGPSGLRSFVQVPIGPSSKPLGALLVAKCASELFDRNWWQVRLHIASTGLLPHVRHAQVDQMAHLLKSMDETQDPVALISVLLRSGSRYMRSACSMRASVRLALLQQQLPAAAPDRALLFEAPRAHGLSPVPGSPPKLTEPSDLQADLLVSHMGLANTLLATALKQQQARFVSDVGHYMKTCLKPARDVFPRSSELVSSIVVVPLIAGSQPPLGAIYFTLDTPCEFANIQDTLLGFVQSLVPMLHSKLAGKAAFLAEAVERMQDAPGPHSASASAAAEGAAASVPATLREFGDSARLPSGPLPSDSEGSDAGGQQPNSQITPLASSTSGRLSKLAPDRLNTDAMLQVLQHEIRSQGRKGGSLSGGSELTLGECLGRGGFGVVYRGCWHKVPVAAKVMAVKHSERGALQDAVEMAVLSSVQHPNIVSVYSCLTDMVEDVSLGGPPEGTSQASSSGTPVAATRFRRLRPEEEESGGPTFNIVVMELCDRGTLRDAIKAGMIHRQLPSGAIGVDLGAAVEVLLDVAYAVQYLHSMQLVHGDIKLENILLKSDQPRRLGVTPKLADFGLTKILNEAHHTVNLDGAGTVTHLAPEMFKSGTAVTKAVDSYAFGILLWEVYTCKRAYSGLGPPAIKERVCSAGLRPRFPASTPVSYASLAESCWDADPSKRPAFAKIAERLEAVASEMAAAPSGGGGRPRGAGR